MHTHGMHIRFDERAKVQNGVWDGGAWVPGTRSLPIARAHPPRPIDPSTLEDAIWWRKAHDQSAQSPYARLWERDEAYLDDPTLFKVRHHINFDTPVDVANVRARTPRYASPGRSIMRTRPLLPTASSNFDELLELIKRLNVKIAGRGP